MSLPVVLFLLRIASAIVLLAFLGLIAWLTYRDLKNADRVWQQRYKNLGALRLIDADSRPGGEGIADRRFPLHSVNSIGRAPTNTIVLHDDFISSEHALLTVRGRQWWLSDLNSRNGTLLNGVRLTTATIVSAGDVIGIGDRQLVLEPAEGESQESA